MQGTLAQELGLQGIILVASVILGMTGFGNALVALPLMLLFMDPKLAIPVMKGVSLLSQLVMQTIGRFPVNWRLLLALAIPAMVGTFVGAAILDVSKPAVLVSLVSIVVLFFSLASLVGSRVSGSGRGRFAPMVGFVAGLLGGSVTLSGPPVVLFLGLEEGGDKLRFRGTLALFFLIEISATLVSYLYFGLFGKAHLGLMLKVSASMLLGLWLGLRIFARFSNEAFRKVVLVSLVALSLGILLTR